MARLMAEQFDGDVMDQVALLQSEDPGQVETHLVAARVSIERGELDAAVRSAQRALTPSQMLGPFYPVTPPLHKDNDLTQVEGRSARAAGQIAQAEEQGEILSAQAEEQAEALPQAEDAVRAASQRANEQRGKAAEVQQQIQLLAASSRNLDERRRELEQRRERLAGERRSSVAPDEARLADLREELAMAEELQGESQVQLDDLSTEVPTLDEARRQQRRGHDVGEQIEHGRSPWRRAARPRTRRRGTRDRCARPPALVSGRP